MPLAHRSNTNARMPPPPPATKAPPRASRTIPAARSQRRESLHIADPGFWPDPSEAVASIQASKQAELEKLTKKKEAERAVEQARREAEAAAEAQRLAVEAAAAEKAAAVLKALDEADQLAAREATDAAARLAAKKKAKLDAQERKARRLSAAAWAERPAMAVWPSEEDLLLGTSVPLTEPATPVQQRYEGRLSRARKVNSERRSVTRQTLTPAAVEKEAGGEEDVKAEVEEVAEMAMVEEEKVEEAAAESNEQKAEAAVTPPPPPPPPAAATAIPRRPSTDAEEQAACSSGAANLYLHTSHDISLHLTISHYVSRYLTISHDISL